MVSLRNYFTITIVMFIIFVLFQSAGVASELLNDYESNPYAGKLEELPGREDVCERAEDGMEQGRERILYIGSGHSSVSGVTQNWAFYKKCDIQRCASPEEYKGLEGAGSGQPLDMAVIDSGSIDWETEGVLDALEELAAAGTNLVFAGLPEESIIEKNRELQKLLGISSIEEKETKAEGIHLYKGFLLGGEAVYFTEDEGIGEKKQDMQLVFPWYRLASGTKTYMSGIMKEEVDYMDYPPIIWRNSLESAYVFAINGDYMEDVAGLGLLSAMSAQAKEYEIYPVVNAQNLVMLNFPGLAAENGDEMMRRYSRSSVNVFRDIMWPDIAAVYRKNGLGISAMLSLQLDYEDSNLPEQEMLIYYMKLLNELNGEAGLSGFSRSDTGLGQKLREDDAFMQESLPDYRFTSFYTAGLPEEEILSALDNSILTDVRTVVEDYSGDAQIIGYVSDKVTKQTVLSDGLRYTYREDFRNKCVETALGYCSVWVDAAEVIYPEDNGLETWQDMEKDFSADLFVNWKNFRGFTGTTVSECDNRIRNFLSLDYKAKRVGDKVHVEVGNLGKTAWFILRINRDYEVSIKGGSMKELEDGVYLIETKDEDLEIALKDKERIL